MLWTSVASTPTPFFGGTLKTVPVQAAFGLVTSPTGTIPISFVSGLPSGFELWVQYGIDDPAAIFGVALSNALKGTVP